MPNFRRAILILAFSLIASLSFAEESGTPSLSINGKKLVLNGKGIFTVTMFKMKIYEGSLYLEKPTHDEAEAKSPDQLKVLRMKFLRDIPEERFKNGSNDAFKKRCEGQSCMAAAPDLQKILSFLSVWKEGTTYDYVIQKDKVELHLDGKKVGEVVSSELAQYFLNSWLSEKYKAPLREKLLGIEPS